MKKNEETPEDTTQRKGELEAFKTVCDTLMPFSQDDRTRILKSVCALFDIQMF